MHRFTRFTIGLLGFAVVAAGLFAAVAPTPGGAAEDAGPGPVGLTPAVAFVGGDPAARATASAAVERFTSMGMALPDLEIRFHEDRDGCDGYDGLFTREGALGRIDLCVDRELLALHELAHAWERFNLDDADRDRFVDLVGAEAWRGDDIAHHRRATEIAADNISYALLSADHVDLRDRPLQLFEALTGVTSPRIAERAAALAGGEV